MSDVLIIGAGLVGAAVADTCAQAGAKVRVIDKAAIGGGASGKSFGWINASFAQTDAYFALRQAAIAEHRVLTARLDLLQATQWNGCIWWEDEGREFWQHAEELAARAYPHRVIEAAEIIRLEPALVNPPPHAIFTEHEGAADGKILTLALLTNVMAKGGRVDTGHMVDRFLRRGGRMVGVGTNQGEIFADHIVVATGTGSEELLLRGGMRLPMDNQPGIILQTTPTKPLINHIIMSDDVHFRQAPTGHFIMGEIFSGGGMDASLDKNANDFATRMLARLHRRLPAAQDVEIAHIHQGLRPVPQDGLPAIGAIGGLYVATMHSGITLAPLVGKMAAQEILHGHMEPMLANFRPDRFAAI